MSTLSDPPAESFRLSQLINDKRYRSITFQFIALLGLIVVMAYLGWNLVQNLAAAGLNLSYGFLGEPAGYDINQTLIEYTSQSSHLRAAVVGVLNTLLVAVVGCFLATVIGVVVGVLRLSKNWLVRKLMAVYVEIFRNVPVLIWILIIMAVFVAVLPQPRDFRGDNPEASMLWEAFAFTGRGFYSPRPFFTAEWAAGGTGWLIVIALLVAGFFGARALANWATKTQEATGVRPTTWYYTLAIWFGPLIIALIAMGLSWEMPELKGFNFRGGIFMRNSLIALTFALAIYTAAFIAENVRAGILAVSKGQTEAAASLGLRPNRIMNLVVLPQALRVIIPPLISQYLNLTKNSSLAIAVGYMDLTGTLGGITLNQTGRAIECVLLLMLFYLTISLGISAIMNVYNNAVKLKER
ncbi:ABC transporter permease subunit [Primorskyibacter aestuariivivens]|uniref:amino acid ABC transporter permease n=1 Tax=Primorskyibacter aestuariivivens TaxID=1888912 RepID=UPI002301FAE6|nr:ABC transporter permease subunit [Primorskyibacter aestuariivivens]MDA7430410.1 ABC transporter permease subunit [Primorskyibacter aestuariivivens]